MPPVITHDSTVNGFVIFNGPLKLAEVSTNHFQGISKNGQQVLEKMPRNKWGLHFTSPAMELELLEAVVASMPKESDIPHKPAKALQRPPD